MTKNRITTDETGCREVSGTKYLALTEDYNSPEGLVAKPLWCAADSPPDVPYIEIEYRVVKHEKRYRSQR